MKKSTLLISCIALVTALVGLIIAISAFLRRKGDELADEYDDDELFPNGEDVDYFSANLDETTPEVHEDAVDTSHPLEDGAMEQDDTEDSSK